MKFLWQITAERLYELSQLLGPKQHTVLIIDAHLAEAQIWWQDALNQVCHGLQVRKLSDLDQLSSDEQYDLIIWTLPPLDFLQQMHAPAVWLKLRLCCRGFLLFATPGPMTAQTLKQSLGIQLPTLPRDLHDLGDDLVRAGWQRPMLQEQALPVAYQHYATLYNDWCELGDVAYHPLWSQQPQLGPLSEKPSAPIELALTLGLAFNGQNHTIQQQLDDGSIAIPVSAFKKKD